MKRFWLWMAAWIPLVLSGIAANAENAPATLEKPSVLCTTFPLYDWARVIIGNHAGTDVDLVFLQNKGVDLHNYSPSAENLVRIARCRLFVYVGGESDDWVEAALAGYPNPRRETMNLVETLGTAAKPETFIEGMEHGHDIATAHDEEEAGETDEHVWLSLRHAQTLVKILGDKIAAVDPAHASDYLANAGAYAAQLAAMDAKYASAIAAAPRKTVLFADRFPFRYLADDYNLSYYAAFAGCSAETEASFKTIAFLAKKVDELGLSQILVIEDARHKIAEAVCANTRSKNQQVLVLDSLQSTDGAMAQTTSYLAVMNDNLAKILQVLSR